ncbi:DNA/RNA helicase domain-containing protein [Streptomyces sparsogenes]|uniref:DNA/RNA helicase domain-containing protein n=1 Tax=Streptomyces sparsogenes TaxID=67365 RepID=UPI0033D0AD0D
MAAVKEYVLKTPPGGVKNIDHDALCDLLKIDDPSRVIFEQARGEAVVRVFPTNPLMHMRPATVADLTMDARGRIVVGAYYDGSPLRIRLFDPKTGNAQRMAIFGTTGAGKSRALQSVLAACKRSGIVVHLADLKEGQSVPEAAGNVATRVTTQKGAIRLLRRLVDEAERRMKAYGEMGRSGFILGDPDPLMYGVIDEANRLLEKGAPYRDEAAGLIKELGRTGRSVGVGIILAAQAGHLEEMGGSDTLRGMLKEGEVILLRWSSAMMAQLVSDGLLPRGESLQPIPKIVGQVRRIRRWNEEVDEDEDEPNSQGMCYHLTSSRPTSMARFFLVGSIAPCRGHDPVILALYGDGPPPGKPFDLDDAPDPEGDVPGGAPAASGRPSVPATAEAIPPGPVTLADRITAALAGGPLTEADLLAAVNADGHKQIKRGSLRTRVSDLRRDGVIGPPSGGLVTLA